jgi:hypothetical protein
MSNYPSSSSHHYSILLVFIEHNYFVITYKSRLTVDHISHVVHFLNWTIHYNVKIYRNFTYFVALNFIAVQFSHGEHITQWIYISCGLIVILCNYLELLSRKSQVCRVTVSVTTNRNLSCWSLSWLLLIGFLLNLYSVSYVLWSCDRVKFWYISDKWNFCNTRFYIFDRWDFF